MVIQTTERLTSLSPNGHRAAPPWARPFLTGTQGHEDGCCATLDTQLPGSVQSSVFKPQEGRRGKVDGQGFFLPETDGTLPHVPWVRAQSAARGEGGCAVCSGYLSFLWKRGCFPPGGQPALSAAVVTAETR